MREPPRSDAYIAAVVTAALITEALLNDTGVPGIVASVVMGVPLAWRRVLPLPAAGAVLAGLVIESAGEASALSLIAFTLAFFTVGTHASARAGAAAVVAATAVLIATDPEHISTAGQLIGNVIFFLLLASALVVAGQAVRQQRRRAGDLQILAHELDRERDERARAAVEEERGRIARELHDVVAHAINVVSVYAGAARIARDRDAQERALERIEDAAGQASTEMRRLLGLLREDAGTAPLPGMAGLEQLVADARAAGTSVTLGVEGARGDLAPGVDLAGFRIVQEGLTNARRHAPGASVAVTIAYSPAALAITIVNRADAGPRGDGSGHGLIGMRERATLYGGTFEAALRDGSFEVRARLPRS